MKKKAQKRTAASEKQARRRFLKKAAYTAPKLVALGYLARPKSVKADFSGGPDGPPGGWTP